MALTTMTLSNNFPNRLAVGLLVGSLLGSAVTAVASAPLREALMPAATAEPGFPTRLDFPKRPLEREWRGYRTPVDPDSMFRKRG